MRVLSDGRVRRSPEEWRRIFERFESSGLSESAFCRREKLSRSNFIKRRRRHERETSRSRRGRQAVPATPTFIEWPVAANELRAAGEVVSGPLAAGELELSLPGGIVLRWKP